MTTKLPIIKFNVKDRGRQFLGQPRDFNIQKLCKSINGGACQERIRTRAMFGYFGHGLRKLVGMDIPESAVISGKYTEIEPAVVTTYLKAYENGDIEHQSEFLDTDSGQRAAKMFESKVGGFSSAIKADNYEFCGMDWVFDSNYVANRPYILDSTDGLILDDVRLEIMQENADFYAELARKQDGQLNELKALLDATNESLESVSSERDRLIDEMSRGNDFHGFMDDSSGFVLPIRLSGSSKASQIERDCADFLDSAVKPPKFVDVETTDMEKGAIAAAKQLSRKWGR
jgi:hypothetical protein